MTHTIHYTLIKMLIRFFFRLNFKSTQLWTIIVFMYTLIQMILIFLQFHRLVKMFTICFAALNFNIFSNLQKVSIFYIGKFFC